LFKERTFNGDFSPDNPDPRGPENAFSADRAASFYTEGTVFYGNAGGMLRK